MFMLCYTNTGPLYHSVTQPIYRVKDKGTLARINDLLELVI